jgi:lipopolysaccharide biosynthesis protein
VIHAFYVDVFEEILAYLKNLDFPVKLFVTTPLGQAGIIKPLIEKCGFEYQLMEVANHGRDVLPFLKIIPDVVGEGFEVFLKLHTKKSKHRQDGAVWLKDILGKLVSPGNAKEIIQTFNDNPSVGIVGPQGHIVPMTTYWGSNQKRVLELAARLGLDRETVMTAPFVAGTMFYGRISGLKPMLNLAISDQNFEAESGQIDGTMAHAIERIFTITVISANQKVVSTDWCSGQMEIPAIFNHEYEYASPVKMK